MSLVTGVRHLADDGIASATLPLLVDIKLLETWTLLSNRDTGILATLPDFSEASLAVLAICWGRAGAFRVTFLTSFALARSDWFVASVRCLGCVCVAFWLCLVLFSVVVFFAVFMQWHY